MKRKNSGGMIALFINGLLLLGFGMAARPAEVMVLGTESRATLLTDRDLPALKRCRYSRVASMLQARCHDLGFAKIPNNLQTDVQILDFTKNRLTKLQNDTLSAYTSLAYLYLQDNFILSIEEAAFSNLRSLQVLDLTENAIQRFPMTVLALPVLRKVYLSSMKQPLQDTAFNTSPLAEESSLEFLDLSHNELTRLPSFGNLPSLTHLNVSENSITSITTKQLAAFCSLNILDLSKNPIKFDASTCDCRIFNAWIKSRRIKMTPEKFICGPEDDSCLENSSENPIFPNETISVFDACREVIRVRAESAKARSTWILVASCVAGSLLCLFVILYCIHKRNNRKKKRQRLKHQKQQQLAANNANTELLNGNMPPEQT